MSQSFHYSIFCMVCGSGSDHVTMDCSFIKEVITLNQKLSWLQQTPTERALTLTQARALKKTRDHIRSSPQALEWGGSDKPTDVKDTEI